MLALSLETKNASNQLSHRQALAGSQPQYDTIMFVSYIIRNYDE